MQPPPIDIAAFHQHIEAWLAHMTALRAEAPDHPMRDVLDQALAQVRQGQATLKTEYQKAMDLIQGRVATVERIRAETMAKLEALPAEVAAKTAAQAPAPPPVDPQLGFVLRQELLDRYARGGVKERDRVDEGSVSKHWVETEEPAASAAAPPPAKDDDQPQIPARKMPAKHPSGEAWEDLSQSEE